MKLMRSSSGQSLFELLIAMSVGIIIVIAGVTAVTVYLRISSTDVIYQGATFLGKELLDNVTVKAEANWHTIILATSSIYYLATSTAGFNLIEGASEVKKAGNFTYYRYFVATSTCRDADDKIASCPSVYDDPLTKKIRVTVEWPTAGATSSIFFERFVSQTVNQTFWQSDWAGGVSTTARTGGFTSLFASSTDAEVSSTPGIIKIKGLQ